jgi:hypothetical protein
MSLKFALVLDRVYLYTFSGASTDSLFSFVVQTLEKVLCPVYLVFLSVEVHSQ